MSGVNETEAVYDGKASPVNNLLFSSVTFAKLSSDAAIVIGLPIARVVFDSALKLSHAA